MYTSEEKQDMKREGKGGGIASENEVQKMFGYSVFDKGNILLYFF